MLSGRSWIFFRLLVNKYYSAKLDTLSKLLPKEEFDALVSVAMMQKNPHLVLFDSERWLGSCDYSWFEPLLSKLPKSMQQLYLGLFPNEMSDGLRSKLNLMPEPAVSYPEPIRQFLLTFLHGQWQEPEAIPKELLQERELSALLYMKRQELLEIIDLLAINDLVDEVRHIVDKRLLQSILDLLSPIQQQYLRLILRQKSKVQPSGLVLKELLKEPKKFSIHLHKRGLQRLGIALSGYNPDFLLHVCHSLDMPRAKFLMQHIGQEPVPNSTNLAQLQILQIIQFLKTDSTT